jgi:hypothetical protein
MKLKNKLAAMLVASGSLVAASSAQAASYAAGDLMLYFFQEGGTQTVYVNLGQAHTFRGATAGPSEAINSPNLSLTAKGEASSMNLNTTLTTAYGSNWATLTNLYAGLAGVRTNITSPSAIQNGDPNVTLYFSMGNNLVDEVGNRTFASSTGMSTAAAGIINMGSTFSGSDSILISPASTSRIDDQNPFSSPNILGTAFGGFAGGVAQAGTAGTFGSFGDVDDVEFALDLHRILETVQPVGTINGVDDQGSPLSRRNSMYEGTITINSSGTVGFSAVPEPSSVMLLGLGAGALAFRRRRNA